MPLFKRQHDEERMQIIRENINYPELDFLLLDNIENFNWDKFFEKLTWDTWTYGGGMLCEAFELISSNDKKDTYKITIDGKINFTFNINMLDSSTVDYKLLMVLADYISDRKMQTKIQFLLNSVKLTKQPIISLVFQDEFKNMNLTGLVGRFSIAVYSGLRECLNEHFGRRNYKPDILMFQVKKGEEVRIQPYINFFGRYRMTNQFRKSLVLKQLKDDTEIFLWKPLTKL